MPSLNRATPNHDPNPNSHRITRVLTAGIAAVALTCGGLAVGGAASAAPAGVSVADGGADGLMGISWFCVYVEMTT